MGELESAVMEIIWRHKGPISVRDIAESLGRKRQVAYTTAMTIVIRLVEKGVLTRHLNGRSYLYRPALSKEQFTARAVHTIFSSAISALGDEVLAYFVKEIQDISPKKRRELLEVLERK